jgi:hypothetical protein
MIGPLRFYKFCAVALIYGAESVRIRTPDGRTYLASIDSFAKEERGRISQTNARQA